MYIVSFSLPQAINFPLKAWLEAWALCPPLPPLPLAPIRDLAVCNTEISFIVLSEAGRGIFKLLD